jgi:hypothetical protein
MKEVLLGLILCVGLVAFNACGSDDNKGGGKKNIIDTSKNYITLGSSMYLFGSSDTYSLSSNQTSFINFGITIVKEGDPVTPNSGDVIWSYTGPNVGVFSTASVMPNQANLILNNSTGTIVVKAQYETIFSTMQIHIVP